MKFSERMGFKKPRVEFQKEDMDSDLINGIWNCLIMNLFNHFKRFPSTYELANDRENEHLIQSIWIDFFKKPIDMCPPEKSGFIEAIRGWFFMSAKWDDRYDFLEFIFENYENKEFVNLLIKDLNMILKRELSAYSIISFKVTPIVSDIEIAEVEKAINSPINEVNKHFTRAIELFSDRKSPDYRNSIKESISAVETMCKTIAQDSKATLRDALDRLTKEGKINLHNALSSAFSNLYGYTSDAEGIRHSLMKEETLDQEDAQFMLVSCSAFVNYLIVKTLKSQD